VRSPPFGPVAAGCLVAIALAAAWIGLARTPASRHRRVRRVLRLALLVGVVAFVVYAVPAYVATVFRVPSNPMAAALEPGDRVLGLRFLYRFTDPARGDVVLLHPNGDGLDAPIGQVAPVTYVRRIVGLPGEWVRARSGHVDVCRTARSGCVPLDEPYATRTADFGPVRVPAGRYFVLGDNRADSSDSRAFGSVRRSQIVARVVLLFWPLSRLGLF
jgi:signal peptidase I